MRVIFVLILCVLAIPAFSLLTFWCNGGCETANAEFHIAAMSGDLVQLRSSIEQVGVPADVRDPNGDTALTIAAAFGREPAVRLLIDRGADVNASNRRGWTALSLASHRGDTATVELLIRAGANVNAASENGRTPLMRAAAAGQTPIVKLLLAHGARKNATDAFGTTALVLAHRAGNSTCAAALRFPQGERLASLTFPRRCRFGASQSFRSHAKPS